MPTPDYILELRRSYGSSRLLLPGVTAVVLREDLEPGRPYVLYGRRTDKVLARAVQQEGLNLLLLVVSVVDGSFQFSGLLGFVVPIVIVVLLRQPASQQYLATRRGA